MFVPKRLRKVFSPQNPLRWNANIRRVRKNRIKRWNCYKETHLDHDFIKFKNAEKEASKPVGNAKRDLQRKIANNIKFDPIFFYKYARSLTKTKSSVGPLIDKDGNLISDDQTMANEFNTFFASVFTTENTDSMPEPKQMFNGAPNEFLT